jgi:hypothetical protein
LYYQTVIWRKRTLPPVSCCQGLTVPWYEFATLSCQGTTRSLTSPLHPPQRPFLRRPIADQPRGRPTGEMISKIGGLLQHTRNCSRIGSPLRNASHMNAPPPWWMKARALLLRLLESPRRCPRTFLRDFPFEGMLSIRKGEHRAYGVLAAREGVSWQGLGCALSVHHRLTRR